MNMTLENPTQPSIKEAALTYAQAGLAVIPLRGRYGANYDNAKLPILKAWQKVVADPALVTAWFNQKPDLDIGLLTGKANNLFILDADKEIGMQTAANLKLPETPVNVTPRGRQYLFTWDPRLDGIPTTLVKPFEKLPGLDFRGAGGFVVCPPSRNLGDKEYKWLDGKSPLNTKIAPIPEWLVTMFLERATIGEDFANAPSIQNNWFNEVKDGVSENRHKAMTKLTSFYMSRGLPEEDVVTLMTLWNQKCTPPKDETEFLRKLNQFLENWRPGGKYKSNFKQVVKAFAVQDSKAFAASTDESDIKWLVEGVIPEETITCLHAYGGLGKSWFALDLAIEVGRGGGLWINHFPTSGGRVLYIDEELHPKLLKKRYLQLLQGKNLTPEEVDINFLSLQHFKLDIPESIQAMKGIILETKPDLIVLDPFVSLHSLNENSTQDMAGLRGVMKDLITSCNVALFIVDHESKPSQTLQTAAQRQRGSGEKDALADVKIALTKDMDGQLIVEHSKTRWGTAFPTFKAKMVDTIPGQATVINFMGNLE